MKFMQKEYKYIMMKKTTFIAFLFCFIINSCITNGTKSLSAQQPIQVFTINAPVAGNYPQSLFKYPYRISSLTPELFTQTIEWDPKVEKTFSVNTQYTAVITLDSAYRNYTFNNANIADIIGLPTDGVENIILDIKDRSLVIRILYETTANEKAEALLLFYDDFNGESLDTAKWDLCPEWDRQGRSSWRDDMVSVSGGMLHLKFKRDPVLGREKTRNDAATANDWIRAGAVRTMTKDMNVLYSNTFAYYEARIKFPSVRGTWGAFWLMSPTQWMLKDEGIDGTEIDIIETLHNHEGKYNAALNWNGYDKNQKSVHSSNISQPLSKDYFIPVDIFDGEFHVFALDWSPSEYVFYVDGKVLWHVDGGAQFKNSGINQNPNYIKLTVEGSAWVGTLSADFSEAEMLVEYVRVYNQPPITD
jgi:beta-glucanase (GH16 family)